MKETTFFLLMGLAMALTGILALAVIRGCSMPAEDKAAIMDWPDTGGAK